MNTENPFELQRKAQAALNQIAPGHNPDKLTVEQVGEGYRLLTPDENKDGPDLKQIHCFDVPSKRWDETGWCGNMLDFTYRTKLTPEQLEALRNPKPQWKLPEPPEGQKWQCQHEWREGMLEEGERPLLDGENRQEGDMYNVFGVWVSHNGNSVFVGCPVTDEQYPHKTKRPLPQKPELKPKWKLPEPPEGKKWQCQHEWREGMLEEGERPLLYGELRQEGDMYFNGNGWLSHGADSDGIGLPATGIAYPHKTKRPLPKKPNPVPAPKPEPKRWDCPQDVPPGAWFRFKDDPDILLQPIRMDKYGMHLAADHLVPWQNVTEWLEYSTDLKTWHPCFKQ